MPTTKHGNQYVIIFQDSKWPFVFAALDQNAVRIVRLLREEVLPMLGVPEALLSD